MTVPAVPSAWYDDFNNWASVYSSVACLAFVVAYSVLAPWWRSAIGRLIMMLVGALAGLATLTLVFYAYKNLELVRVIRGFLIIMVGTALWFQVVAVIRTQLRDRRNKP